MAITIKKVSSKKELKTFIRFNYELYKENPYSVPDLYDDNPLRFVRKEALCPPQVFRKSKAPSCCRCK